MTNYNIEKSCDLGIKYLSKVKYQRPKATTLKEIIRKELRYDGLDWLLIDLPLDDLIKELNLSNDDIKMYKKLVDL
jgi:hypothetical protein